MKGGVLVRVVGVDERPLIELARVGDRVTILTPQGHRRTGRVVMKFPSHLVLNGGGAHGTPLVANDSNTIAIKRAH